MKTTIKIEKEIDIKYLAIKVAVRYDEEDIPNDFPFRDGDTWGPVIDFDNGQILDWPKGIECKMHMKICDEGSYYLLDENKNTVLSIEEDYVPKVMCPGGSGYGDYIIMNIDENGKIANWKPTIIGFGDNDED